MASSLNIVNLSGQYPGLNKGQFSGNPQGLIIHHTASSDNTTPQNIAAGWLRNGLSSQYIIGRDGTVYQMVADGGQANHIMPSWGAPSTKWANNKTAMGVELIAKDDSDVTPAQTTAASQLSTQLGQQFGFSPQTHVLGHGDVNGYGAPPGTAGTLLRQPSEGQTAVNALHNALSQADVRTANPLGGPSGLSAADYTNGIPNNSSPSSSASPRSFTIPSLPSSSTPPAGITFSKVISGGGDAPLVVQGTDGNTYTVAGDQNLKYNNPTAMKYDQFAIDNGAIGSASRPGQTPLAIFPSLAAGQAAAAQRLFGDNSKYSIPAYKDMTLGQAIKSWAPGGVDSNRDPTSYINGIAKALGISPDTKLSDLSPAQQSQFIAAQQHQEGSKPQVITDSQGKVIAGSAPPVTPPGYNAVTDAQRTAMAALPTTQFGAEDILAFKQALSPPAQPSSGLSAGDSLAFNPTGSMAGNGSQMPLFHTDPATGRIVQDAPPAPNSSGSPDERGSQTVPLAPGYNSVTNAQRTAMAALPTAQAPIPPAALQAALAPPTGSSALTEAQRNAMLAMPPTQIAPIPATRPPGLGDPVAAAPAPQTATLPTGKTIQVGKNYSIGGNQYVGGVNAQGVGTLTKVNSILSQAAPGTIAGGIARGAIGSALSTAGTNLRDAAGVAGADLSGALHSGRDAIVGGAQNAANGIGGFLGGIFGSGGSTPPVAVAMNSSGSPDERGTTSIPSPAPGYNAVTDAQRTAMAALPPSAPTYQNITVANPAYTTWVESYGDAAQAAARTKNPMGGPNGLSAADFYPPSIVPPAPAPRITIRVPNSSGPPDQRSNPSPPPAQQVQLASGSMGTVGQTFSAGGYTYRVNADGSTTNTSTGHTYGTPAPTNNLATSGYYASSPQEASTNANSTQSQLDSAMAYNAAHPGVVGEWMMGMPLEWRGTVNPAVPRTLPGASPTPANNTPPTPQAPPSNQPVLSPPRYNGPPPVTSSGNGNQWRGIGPDLDRPGPQQGNGNSSDAPPPSGATGGNDPHWQQFMSFLGAHGQPQSSSGTPTSGLPPVPPSNSTWADQLYSFLK